MARQRHNTAFITGSVLGGVGGAAAALWKAPRSGSELRTTLSKRLGMSGEGSASMPAGAPASVSTASETTEAPASSASSTMSKAWNATRASRVSVANASRASLAQVSRASSASRDTLASTVSKGKDSGNNTSSGETRSFGGRALSFVENAAAPIVGVKLGQSVRKTDAGAMETVRTAASDPAPMAEVEHPPAASVAEISPERVVSSTPAQTVAPVTRERVVSNAHAAPAAVPAPAVAPVTHERAVSSTASAPPLVPVDTPTPQSTGEPEASGVGSVASTEDLVTPVIPDEPKSTQEPGSGSGSFTDFPDFEADKRPQ